MLRETGLTVGVGIGQTKTLAKLANFAAKKWSKTGGVVDLSNQARQRKLMGLVPVAEVWGIGRRLSKKLNVMGIENALHLADASTTMIRKHFSVVIERTVRELRGEPCLALEEFAPTKQQIICSRSFGDRITDYDQMHQAIYMYATRAAEKLREERQYCRHVSAWIKTSPFALRGVLRQHGQHKAEHANTGHPRYYCCFYALLGCYLAAGTPVSERRCDVAGFFQPGRGATWVIRRVSAAEKQ